MINVSILGNDRRYVMTPGQSFTIGRAIDCEIRIYADTSVSRYHCMIRFENEDLIITDLNSMNGTRVNGQVIDAQTQLHHGDVIRLAATEINIHAVDDPTAADGRMTTETDIPTIGNQKLDVGQPSPLMTPPSSSLLL